VAEAFEMERFRRLAERYRNGCCAPALLESHEPGERVFGGVMIVLILV